MHAHSPLEESSNLCLSLTIACRHKSCCTNPLRIFVSATDPLARAQPINGHQNGDSTENNKPQQGHQEKRSSRQKLGSQHKGTGRAVVLPAAYISWAIKLTLGPHTCIPARHIYWRSRKLMLAYEQLLSSVNHCRTSLEAYCLPFISQASRNPLPSSARCLAIKSKCCLLGRGLLQEARVEDRPLHYEVQNMVGEYT